MLVSPLSEPSAGGPADKFCDDDAHYSCFLPASFAQHPEIDSDVVTTSGNSSKEPENIPMVFLSKNDGALILSYLSKSSATISIQQGWSSAHPPTYPY